MDLIILVSREQLVEMIIKAFSEINEINKTDRRIGRAFRMCGLDPYAKDETDFMKHLDTLSESKVYRCLTEVHEAVNL